MFRHVIMFKWKDEATDEQKRAAYDALARLPDDVREIRSWHLGPDAGLYPGEDLDFVIIADFDSKEDYWKYRYHPAHVKLIDEHTMPIMARLARVQYETDQPLG